MTFFQDGGWGMWATLAMFLAFGIAAVVRRDRGGDQLALVGAAMTAASAMLGFSTGIYATVEYLATMPADQQAVVLATGIRESANNLTLGAGLTLALGATALALALRRSAGVTPAA